MGWWRPAGKSYTIGDGPLDTLGVAVDDVIREYQAEWSRNPTPEEWQSLLGIALGSDPPGERLGASSNPTVQLLFPGSADTPQPPAFPDVPIPGVPYISRCSILGFDLDAFSRRTEPRLDLLLRNHRETILIRFWDPRELELSGGGPPIHGLVISDRSSAPRGTAAIDVSASDGARKLSFVARALEILQRTKHPHIED